MLSFIYVWNLGDGFDNITEKGGDDTIRFGEGISFDDLTFKKDGSYLRINVNGDSNQGIRASGHFNKDANKIERLEFADGMSIDISSYANADQLIQAMSSFSASLGASLLMNTEELNVVDNVITGNYKNVA